MLVSACNHVAHAEGGVNSIRDARKTRVRSARKKKAKKSALPRLREKRNSATASAGNYAGELAGRASARLEK